MKHNFMVYTRDEGGRIARQHNTVAMSADEIRDGYQHHEKLMGWPEKDIYWSTPYGLGNGLAPASDAAKQSLT